MKILLLTTLVALASADVSHLSSYGPPQGSVIGQALPSTSGSSVQFSGGYSSAASQSVPSVNFVQYSQPSNGYQYSSQFSSGSDASLNSGAAHGFNFGGAASQEGSGFNFGGASQGVQSSVASNGGSNGGSGFNFGGASQGVQSSVASNGGLNGGSGFNFGGASQGVQSSVASNGAASYNFGASEGANQQGSGLNFGGASGQSSTASSFGGFSGATYQGQTSGGSIDESFGVSTDAFTGASADAAADVSKHLYFFSAPEEEDEVVEAKYDFPAVPAKKTYKIIFIKAPTYKNQASITIPAPPQNEEKTLVYVLVKKPEGQPKVHFKNAEPTQPSKPEVFFIKYKTQKEAEAAVAEIQSKHGAGGQVIANLPAGTQAALQAADGSIVNNPSSVDIGSVSGFGASAGGASSSFGGSISGASSSSFGGSASGASSGGFSSDSQGANSFDSSIASRISEQSSEGSEQNNGATAQFGANVQYSTSQSADAASSSGINNVQSSGSSSQSESQQDYSSISTTATGGEEGTTTENTVAGEDCCSGSSNVDYSAAKYKRLSGKF